MKWFILMVLFSTPADRAPHHHPDFGPLKFDTMADCLLRRSFAQKYFRESAQEGVMFSVFCVEFRALGYDEAKDAFARKIGVVR